MAVKGRPKSEEKRQQIFQAAKELFMQHGFDGVSMDMVAEQAGVSKQTVYSHFRNKDELYGETISLKCRESMIAPEFMDDERRCDAMLLDIARGFTQLLLSKQAVYMYRLSTGHAEQHPHISRLFYQWGPDHTIQTVADYLAHQHNKGTLNIADPRTAACQFLYMLKADAITRAVMNVEAQPSAAEIEAYLQSCVEMFMRAYGV
jgi:AcrR family transcriptional regulator